MICPNCAAENRAGRKFCTECGTPLSRVCPACGAAIEGDERFCGECGTLLNRQAQPSATTPARPAGPPAAAERRLVSVLFADLVGFTTLSEHRDSEEVRDLLSRYFDSAREVIARYGGTVEKFIGDAVMAVWGTPVAHEDDPERAVRAALELIDGVAALGSDSAAPDLRLRAGVLTGEAAVTIGAEGQGMVAGDLVNTAARLQSAAAPGTVLVGESTYHAAKRAIAFEGAGEHVLKGKELPIQAWRAARVIAGHQGFRKAETLEPPFVGRERELRLVKDLLHAVASENKPRLVSVMGIGGIGKSRLAWEFFKYVDGVVDTIYWHHGRSPAYGEGVTFWALGEMVRMRARIAETDDARSSRAKLTAALEDYIPQEQDRRWIEPRLAHLLGLEDKAPGEREELFAAWRTFFERVSDRGPTVLVFEDLQWADPGLIDFIEHVLEWSRSYPILIVTLARPELMEKRPTWGAGQRNFISLYLEPLSKDSMRQLLLGLAGDLPDSPLAQILERAEGVPLYAVEMVRMLVDQGLLIREDGSYRLTRELLHLDIPDSLHGLIASRLDVLDPEERALLQNAAVLGKTFTVQALAAVADKVPAELEPRLKDLVPKELLVVETDPRSPERGQYGFVQSLIREVAYQTLSKHDRVLRHLAAAHHFEASGDEELASVVATHYLEAFRASADVPQAQALAARASDSLMTAAERASSLGAHEQALAYLEQALSVASDPAERVRLWEQAAESARKAGALDVAETYLTQALRWHEDQGDRSAAARATAHFGTVLLVTGRVDPAIEKLEKALEQLADLEDDPSVAELTAELARAYMLKSDATRAIKWADLALVAAERLNLVPVIADALITKGSALDIAGRWREAVVLLRGALALAEEERHSTQQARALANLASLLASFNPSDALTAAREGLLMVRKLGLRDVEPILVANACDAAIVTGDWDWVETTVADLYPEVRPFQVLVGHHEPIVKAFRGDAGAAAERLRAVAMLIDGPKPPQYVASFRWAESLVALSSGALDEAYEKAMFAVAADPTAPAGIFGYVIAARASLWAHNLAGAVDALNGLAERRLHGPWIDRSRNTLRAGVVALEGNPAEATTLFTSAFKAWREMQAPFDLALSQLDFLTLIRDGPDSGAAAEEARAIFTKLGAKPFLARLETAVKAPETSPISMGNATEAR